jgi:hypothetical protein
MIKCALNCLLFLLALSGAVSAQGLPDQIRPGEAFLGPVQVDHNVYGIPVSVRTHAFLSAVNVEDAVELNVRIVSDLSDLQSKASAIVDKIELPKDNCNHFGIDNLVASIGGKKISVEGDVATLELNGDVKVWTCAKNPIPCTRLDGWNLVFYDCNPPVKNLNLTQPFDAKLPFQLQMLDQRTIGVVFGDPTVNLGGILGGVSDKILKIAGVDINRQAKEALDSLLNPDLLKMALPEEISSFNPILTTASLQNKSGALMAYMEMKLTVDQQTLKGLGGILHRSY